MQDKASPKFDESLEKAVRDAAHEITLAMMTYFVEQEVTINEIVLVPVTLLGRIIRTHDAIQLLVKEQHFGSDRPRS